MPRLTKRVVDAAEPHERDYFIWCDDLPDLVLARQAGYVRAGTADQGTLDHDRSSSLPRKFPRDVFARLAAAEDEIFDLVGFRHRLLRCDLHDGSCNGRVDPGVFLSFVTEVDRSVSAHPVRCI